MTTTAVAGEFFLSSPASSVSTPSGKSGVALKVREPAPQAMFPNGLLVHWIGPEAVQWHREHQAELRRGRGVRLRLTRFRASGQTLGQLVASAEECELLPLAPSWQHKATEGGAAT